jgi:hypothetical protein
VFESLASPLLRLSGSYRLQTEVLPVSRLITPLKRLRAPIGLTALLAIASSAPGAAQVMVQAYPPPPPLPYAMPDTSVKFDVKPKNAAIYVDGFYAGIVDDFDGAFQRLRTAPGGHEITLYLDGYRTITEKAYLSPDHTFKIQHRMEKLTAGEVSERPPAPPALPPPDQQQGAPGGRYGRGGPPPQYQPPPPNAPPPSSSSSPAASGGTLELNLQPADAEVFVDGQPWRGSGQARVTIDLPEGQHSLQIRKTGYVGYLTDVQIRHGETTRLDVNLRTQPETPR